MPASSAASVTDLRNVEGLCGAGFEMNGHRVVATREIQREREVLRLVCRIPNCDHGVVAVRGAPVGNGLGRALSWIPRGSTWKTYVFLTSTLPLASSKEREGPCASRMRFTLPRNVLSPALPRSDGTSIEVEASGASVNGDSRPNVLRRLASSKSLE